MLSSHSSSVSSVRNPLIRKVRKALDHGSLTEDGLCAIEGHHLLEEAMRSGLEIDQILASRPVEGIDQWVEVPDSLLAEIATTQTSPKVIALVRPPLWSEPELFRAPALTVILDGVQDPGNAGTILRSAEAFGATGVVFRKGTVSPWNSKVLRASAGSIFRVPHVAGDLKIPVPLYAADPHRGAPIHHVDWSGPCAIIIGSEAHGIRPDLESLATPVRIPTHHVESLNAGISASLVLYEIARQREFI